MKMSRRAAQFSTAVVLAAGISVASASSASAAWSDPPKCNGTYQQRYDWGWKIWDSWSGKSYGGRVYYEYRFSYYGLWDSGATVMSYGSCWA